MRFRYRTPALVGKWRDTREAAIEDAIAARQADRDEADPALIVWRGGAELEECTDDINKIEAPSF